MLDPAVAFRMVYHAADGLFDDLLSRHGEADPEQVSRYVRELAHRALGDTSAS